MTETVFTPTATPFARDKYAREYERGRSRLIENLIEDGAGARALDIGCGPGYFTRMLSGKGWRVTAVDTDAENLEQARPFATEVRRADALSFLAGAMASYDLGLAIELIEHVPREQGDTGTGATCLCSAHGRCRSLRSSGDGLGIAWDST